MGDWDRWGRKLARGSERATFCRKEDRKRADGTAGATQDAKQGVVECHKAVIFRDSRDLP